MVAKTPAPVPVRARCRPRRRRPRPGRGDGHGEADDVAPAARAGGGAHQFLEPGRCPQTACPTVRRPPRPKLVIAAADRPRRGRPRVRNRVRGPARGARRARRPLRPARSPSPGTPSAWSAGIRTSRCAGCCSPSTRRPRSSTRCSAAGADLLVTHHPLLLTPVHGAPAGDPKGRLVHRLIRGRRGLFVAHTNADRAPTTGVNDALAAVLDLRVTVPLEPAGRPTRGPGWAGWASWSAPMTLREFAAHAAAVLPATVGGVRVAGDPDREVRTVAVCGGSGGSLIETAAAAGADVLLTSDLKHHPVSESRPSDGASVTWHTSRPSGPGFRSPRMCCTATCPGRSRSSSPCGAPTRGRGAQGRTEFRSSTRPAEDRGATPPGKRGIDGERTSPPAGTPAAEVTPRRSDRSPWNWLLLVPIVVPLLVPLYNSLGPTIGGWPRFYWLQLLSSRSASRRRRSSTS